MEIMTLQDVRHVLSEIERFAETDGERAHSLEDKLHRGVLRFVASYSEDTLCAKLCREALHSLDIDIN